MEVSPGKPILIDKFLESAIEVDVDCLSDGQRTLIGGVMQHIEEAGIHSGDSACVIPPHSLPADVVEEIKRQTRELARELNVKGLMNVQFAVQAARRAGTTVSTSSRSTRGPAGRCRSCPRRPACRWPGYAALVMVGKTLDELGLHRRGGAEALLGQGERLSRSTSSPAWTSSSGPEMRSTGEVMGIDDTFPMAFAKSQLAASSALPPAARSSSRWPTATSRTWCRSPGPGRDGLSADLDARHGAGAAAAGIAVEEIPKLQEGRPNLIDYMKNDQIALVINTPSGKGARTDEGKIRAAAVAHGVTCITTLAAAQAAVEALAAMRDRELTVKSLQERL